MQKYISMDDYEESSKKVILSNEYNEFTGTFKLVKNGNPVDIVEEFASKEINNLIPKEASVRNQLADKHYVDTRTSIEGIHIYDLPGVSDAAKNAITKLR